MKTPWFNATVEPLRIGLYECDLGNDETEADYWNGTRWTGSQRILRWRGLEKSAYMDAVQIFNQLREIYQ